MVVVELVVVVELDVVVVPGRGRVVVVPGRGRVVVVTSGAVVVVGGRVVVVAAVVVVTGTIRVNWTEFEGGSLVQAATMLWGPALPLGAVALNVPPVEPCGSVPSTMLPSHVKVIGELQGSSAGRLKFE